MPQSNDTIVSVKAELSIGLRGIYSQFITANASDFRRWRYVFYGVLQAADNAPAFLFECLFQFQILCFQHFIFPLRDSKLLLEQADSVIHRFVKDMLSWIQLSCLLLNCLIHLGSDDGVLIKKILSTILSFS